MQLTTKQQQNLRYLMIHLLKIIFPARCLCQVTFIVESPVDLHVFLSGVQIF